MQSAFRFECILTAALGGLLLASCTAKPRGLQPYGIRVASGLPATSGEYDRELINNPEMYPRELKMPERKELLRVNWAMQKAQEDGKLTVRLLAPLLQLTGDPNLDRASTYEAVLVADDLGTNKFLDKYEVRISPKPELYVVRPSASGKSLKNADLILAEEELSRLRLDEAALNTGAVLATNLEPILNKRLAEAKEASSNEFARISTQIGSNQTQITSFSNALTALTKSIMETNALLTAMQNSNASQAAISAVRASLADLNGRHDGTNTQLITLQTLKLDMDRQLLQSQNAQSALRSEIDAARHLGDLTAAYHAAIGSFAGFWEKWATSRVYWSEYSTNGPWFTNLSAVSVLFRPQAVANLSYVSIDVLRTGELELTNSLSGDANTNVSASVASTLRALKDTLVDIDDFAGQFSRLLLAPRSQITSSSRQQHAEAVSERLGAKAKQAQGYFELYTNHLNAGVVGRADINNFAVGSSEGAPVAVAAQALLSLTIPNVTNGLAPKALAMVDNLQDTAAKLTQSSKDVSQLVAEGNQTEKLVGKIKRIRSLAAGAKWDLEALSHCIRTNTTAPVNQAPTPIQIVSNANVALAAVDRGIEAIDNEEKKSQQLNAVKSSLSGALSNINFNVSMVYSNLYHLKREELSPQIREIQQQAQYAQVLASGIYATEAKANVYALGNPDDAGVVGRILRGQQAVFRIDVLHGLVTTTGFLMADDGASQMFGQAFANEFYTAQVTLKNQNDKPILVYGNTMRLVVRMNAVRSDGRLSEDGLPLRQNWWATYEPLDYDAVRRMMEGQQEHSWQKNVTKIMDLALMAGGGWVGVGAPGEGFTRAFGVVSALSPKLRDLIEADLRRNANNFREKGLHDIEEIPAQGIITRYVFVPKGPIYGTYAYDEAAAADLPLSSHENRAWKWLPFVRTSRDFGQVALQPAYIHDMRREEVYVDGKRILASDPLSSAGTK